jgi:hypothetical protein
MQPRPEPSGASDIALPRAQRLFGRWWRRQSPTRQDRFATIAPLISVLLFLAAIIAAFWYLRNEEIEREADAVQRDTEISQQQVRLYLSDDLEQLLRLARDISDRSVDAASFAAAAADFARERSAITHVSWIGASRSLRAGHAAAMFHPEVNPSGGALAPNLPVANQDTQAERAFLNARGLRAPHYSGAFRSANGTAVFQLYVPLFDQGSFNGALVAEYSIESMLRQMVPPEVTQRHTVAVVDADGHELAGSVLQMPGQTSSRPTIVVDLPLAPAANGLALRGMGWRTSVGLVSNTLFWMVLALSVLTVWMLWAPGATCVGAARCRTPWCKRRTSGARWRTPCSPECAPWTPKAASLRQPGLLRHDRLRRRRTRGPSSALPLLAPWTASRRTRACCNRNCRDAARPAASR